MGWLSGWSKRQAITLTGGADGSQVDFQLKLSIAYDSDMQSDFDDLRFTKEDGETLIDAWLEDETDSTSADVYVEFPTTPANGETQTYYMYYGKADAVNYWDIGATFLFGEDFEYTDDPSNHGWTDSTGNAQTSTGQYKRGSRSLFLDASNADRIYRARSGAQIIEFDYYDPDSTDDSQDLMAFDAINDWNMAIGTNKNTVLGNYIRAIPAGWQDTGIARSVGWHHVIIEFDGSVFNIWMDGTKIVDNITETLENIYFYSTNSSGYSEDFYIDDVRVRKYTANPPTYEFGSEESESGGLSMAVVMHHLRQMRRS